MSEWPQYVDRIEPDASRVVLFDFDGTLISGDSGTRLILRIATGRIWPLLPMTLCAPLLVPLLLLPPTKNIGASGFLWLSTVGMEKRTLNRRLKQLARDIAGRADRVQVRAGWQRLQYHRRRGDRIVIVTGCWVKLARRILAAMNMQDAEVIGSRKHRFLGGYISKPHCYSRHKLACLENRGIHPPFVVAYTDSASDRHLLANAGKKVLVCPSPYTRAVIRYRFPDVEILG